MVVLGLLSKAEGEAVDDRRHDRGDTQATQSTGILCGSTYVDLPDLNREDCVLPG